MTILLLGGDDTAQEAWMRAGRLLPDALDFQRASSADSVKGLESVDGALALESLSDETAALLAGCGAPIVYAPPLFDSAARLRQLDDLARTRDAWFLPLMPLRMLPVIQRVKAIAASGKLGRLLYLKATYNQRLPRDNSGLPGALEIRGCHAIDLARWLLDCDIADIQLARGGEDMAILSFAMTDRAYATVDISWSLPPGYPKPASITIEMAGTGGSIRSDALNQTLQWHGGASSRDLHWGSDIRAEALRSLIGANECAPAATLRHLAAAQALCEGLA